MNNKKQILNDKLLQSINEEHPDTDNYLLPDQLTKKVKSTFSLKSDLADAHAALKELSVMHLIRNGEEIILTSLWKAGIITYGKCFTQSDDGGPKLEVKDCFKDYEYFIPIHDSLMSVRHGFIAHRGDNEFEETVVLMKVDKNEPEATTYAMKSFRAGTSSFSNLVDYLNVIEHLQQYVESRMQKQLQKIHDHIHRSSDDDSQ